jgi:hypothetical protein
MPAGNTYEAIATQTLGSATASVTFSSIPSTYTDLVIVVNGTMSASENSLGLRLNGDTATNYSSTALYGDGVSAASLRQTNDTKMYLGRMTSVNNSTSLIYVQNYSNTTTNKTVLSRGNSTAIVMATVSLWRSTAAVTSVTVSDYASSNFLTGTTFSLYGIKAA